MSQGYGKARMLRTCKFHKKLIEKAAGTSYNIVRTVQINIDGLADKALEGQYDFVSWQ